jgi:3-phenylpropionate/trans-cinnamate dioxygenase ferredoxin subunit
MSTISICRLDELVEGEARRFDVADARLCVVRIGDDVLCIADRCSHEDFSLSQGDVFVAGREIECVRHGAIFDLTTGEPCSLPATKPVATFAASVVDGMVEVEVG